jgi:hypothetical protein
VPGFRGISSLAALAPVFHVPALPAVPLALDLSAGRQTKTIGRGVIVMRVFVIDVNNMAWTCRVG